jgi:hypothetical protein
MAFECLELTDLNWLRPLQQLEWLALHGCIHLQSIERITHLDRRNPFFTGHGPKIAMCSTATLLNLLEQGAQDVSSALKAVKGWLAAHSGWEEELDDLQQYLTKRWRLWRSSKPARSHNFSLLDTCSYE